jgi:hypothetical protein
MVEYWVRLISNGGTANLFKEYIAVYRTDKNRKRGKVNVK